MVDGDTLSCAIACASILAKTHRDGLMRELDQELPGYGFGRAQGLRHPGAPPGPARPWGLPGAPAQLRPGGGPGAARGDAARRAPGPDRAVRLGGGAPGAGWPKACARPTAAWNWPGSRPCARATASAWPCSPAWGRCRREGGRGHRAHPARRALLRPAPRPRLPALPGAVGIPRRQAGIRGDAPGGAAAGAARGDRLEPRAGGRAAGAAP